MQKTRICHITTVHSPFDARIFHKECRTLEEAGYDVNLLVTIEKDSEINGVKFKALPTSKNRVERILKSIFFILTRALQTKSTIYHFHDPELIPVLIIIKAFGKKVIYDVHEDVPKQMMNKEWLGNRFIRQCVAFIVNIIEQFGALFFDGIAAATEDIAKKFKPSKTILLRNFPIMKLVDRIELLKIKKERPIIIYAGGLSKIRGIKEVIQAMEYVRDRAELWLLGDWENELFKRECEELKGWKYTKYFGNVPLNVVYQHMKKADIGLAMLYPVNNYLTSLPIKAFEYMACSLPIVMSNFPYWKEMFGGCALFANPHDTKSIAENILYLLNNSDKARELGAKGRELIETKYSWEAESKKLINLYERLLAEELRK